MRRPPRHDNQNLRRRKRQQRRVNQGAANPLYYTECSYTSTPHRETNHDRNRH